MRLQPAVGGFAKTVQHLDLGGAVEEIGFIIEVHRRVKRVGALVARDRRYTTGMEIAVHTRVRQRIRQAPAFTRANATSACAATMRSRGASFFTPCRHRGRLAEQCVALVTEDEARFKHHHQSAQEKQGE